jgi:hypothetical protein
MRVTRCPEAAWGIHGTADIDGKCPYCKRKIDSVARFGPDPDKRRQNARAQDPRSVDGWNEEDYLDGRG